MKQVSKLSGILAVAIGAMFVSTAIADDDNTAAARLTGYQETPLTLNSPGSGTFKLRISKDEMSIDFQLTYQNLPAVQTPPQVNQAHIHFGRPALNGGVVLFLCTNLAPPAGVPTPQPCPDAPATVTGTLTAADVIAVPGQSITAGPVGFADIIKAIRAKATYANVHTPGHPGGEIRGRITDNDNDNDHDGDHNDNK
jgi:hypothetical protein